MTEHRTGGVDIGTPGHVLYVRRGRRILRVCRSAPGDEHKVVPRADFAEALAEEGGCFPGGLRWKVEQTLMLDDGWNNSTLGIGGLEPLGDGRWAVWAYMADLTPRQWAFAAWSAWEVLQWAKTNLTPRTVQVVPAPTVEAVRLLKRIGFVDVGEAYMVWEG